MSIPAQSYPVTREELGDYKGKKAWNVYAGGCHIGSYEGELNMLNPIEIKAKLMAEAPAMLRVLEKISDLLKGDYSEYATIKAIEMADGAIIGAKGACHARA